MLVNNNQTVLRHIPEEINSLFIYLLFISYLLFRFLLFIYYLFHLFFYCSFMIFLIFAVYIIIHLFNWTLNINYIITKFSAL
jgi:hypothetical protein